MLHALLLLEELEKANLKFTFKGGTSIILLVDEPRRFSIDIDICCESIESIENIFKNIIETTKFTKYEENIRKSSSKGVPKKHFKFYYDPESPADYILLDILIDKSNYPKIKRIPINTDWLITEGKDISVNVCKWQMKMHLARQIEMYLFLKTKKWLNLSFIY